MDIFLNGHLVAPDDARVALDDAGLQHGIGLFETMAAYHGRVFRLDAHLDRLAASAVELGLSRELHTQPLAEAVRQTLAHNGIDRARVRLTLTPGPLNLLRQDPDHEPQPTLAIVPTPPTEYDPQYFEQGITVLVYKACANPFEPTSGHKTLAYWPRLRSLRQAAAAGAGECVWLNLTNHLASGAVSNLFLVKDGVLRTPIARGEEADDAMPAPVLPGITRAAVIELAEAEGIEVQRKMLGVPDLLEADEAFLTNSSWHVLPVTKVEASQVATGEVGPVTTMLRKRLLDTIERETGD